MFPNAWFTNYGQLIQAALTAISALVAIIVGWQALESKILSTSWTKVFAISAVLLVAVAVFNALNPQRENPQRDYLPAEVSAAVKELPSESRNLLMQITGQREAWPASHNNSTTADPLKDHGYAVDLKQEVLHSLAASSGRDISHGIELTEKGVKLHDQMVKVLGDMIGTTAAEAWIKEVRHEPGTTPPSF
jgi:hypothetical protein